MDNDLDRAFGDFVDHDDFDRNDYHWPDEDDYASYEKDESYEPWWSFYIEKN